MQDLIHFSAEVAAALDNGRAVAALESTIITHGIPYPENLAIAREVEAIVRENGATPATMRNNAAVAARTLSVSCA